MKNLRGCYGLIVLALASGTVHGVGVSGTVRYTDGAGTAQPARRIQVEVYAVTAAGQSLVATTSAANDGSWASDVNGPAGTLSYNVRYVAHNDGAHVSATGAGNAYSVAGPAFPAAGGASAPATIDTAVGGNAERAFAVADALQTSWLYSGIVRTAAAARLPTAFPTAAPGDASFYQGGTINIRQWRRYAWDVINHEYGHYLADIDTLDNNPGDFHSFGINNIGQPTPNHPNRTKSEGVRVAWGEGLATYTGTASQVLAAHPNSPTVGDAIYTSLNTDDPARTFSAHLDNHDAYAEGGEAEEVSVMRILWDLSDATNGSEPHDRVTLGHTFLYDIINRDIAGIDELDDLWDHLFSMPVTTDARRADYGAIFEEYGVSPHPVGAAIGATFNPAGPAPTFDWLRRNDNRNDEFRLLVFNNAMTAQVLNIAIPGDVQTYTLTGPQWDTLRATNGDYKFVIAGSDTTTYTTGSYWSDAYGFQVIPTPGALALIGVGGLLAARRRR